MKENTTKNTKLMEFKIGSPEWTKQWMKERKAKRVSKATSLKDLGVYLKDLGYKFIRVYYEGAGDSGESFEAEGWKGDIDLNDNPKFNQEDLYQHKAYGEWVDGKCIPHKDEWKDMTRNQKKLGKEYQLFRKYHPDNNLQDEFHYELVELVDYDWYNNEGGQGELVWDLEKEEFRCNGEQNTYSCYDVKETYFMDGREPITEYSNQIHER